tara:strand:+ start:1353 stop:1892 length:540 start_codon:yes stop_codon:yes gene_type:complete
MIKKIFSNLIFIILFIACSSSQNDQNAQGDIFDGTYDNVIFSKTSFDSLGFKFSKEYDVSELPDALEAHYGFFQRREFEIRFYPSNEIAKSAGIFFAEEATGEDAIIKKSDASWKEGIKDRMTSGAFGNKKNTPRYMDYVILGNMIVLCPIEISSSEIGATEPLDNCKMLLSRLPEINK